MRPLKAPTGQWAVVVRGAGAKGNEGRMVRVFTAKPEAVSYAHRRQAEGRDTALFYSHTIPPWTLRELPPSALGMSDIGVTIDLDGESISPTPPARQRPAGDLDEGDDPHPARR